MAKLHVPAQDIDLQPVSDRVGLMMGELLIGVDFSARVEAYALDSSDPIVNQLIDELHVLAECGDSLAPIEIDGREYLLAIMPRGR